IIGSISKSFRMLIQIGITCVGAYLALHNEVSVGGMIASSILAGRALAPFEAAIGLWRTVLAARDAYERLDKELSRPLPFRGHMDMPAPKGLLQVEGLFFRPPGSENVLLRNVAFTLEPGT